MTRVHFNARPMDYTRGLHPMSREDARFLSLRRGDAPPKGWLQRILRRK